MDTEYRIETWRPYNTAAKVNANAGSWLDAGIGPYVSLMAAEMAVASFNIQAPYRIVVVVPITQTI